MSLVKGGHGKFYKKLEAMGNNIGNVWDDGPGGRIEEICVCHDRDKICSIQTTYGRDGKVFVSSRHGGKGERIDIITPYLPIKWIKGYYSSWGLLNPAITNISFGNDVDTYGPFGYKKSPDEKFFSFKSGRDICGFHGSSLDVDGGHLCTIGVYYKTSADGYVDQAAMPSCSS